MSYNRCVLGSIHLVFKTFNVRVACCPSLTRSSPLPYSSSVLCTALKYPLSPFLNAHHSAFTATVIWPSFSLSPSLSLCSTTAAPSITHMHPRTHNPELIEWKQRWLCDRHTGRSVRQLHMHACMHACTHSLHYQFIKLQKTQWGINYFQMC